MHMLFVSAISLLLVAKAFGLKCYECTDCPITNEDNLYHCFPHLNEICITNLFMNGTTSRSCGHTYGNFPKNSCQWYEEKYACTCSHDSCNGKKSNEFTENTQQCHQCKNCDSTAPNQIVSCPWYKDTCFISINSFGEIERGCDFLYADDILVDSCPTSRFHRRCKCSQDSCNGAAYVRTSSISTTTSISRNTIKCYSCENCTTVDDLEPQFCPITHTDVCTTTILLDGSTSRHCGDITGDYPTNSCRWYEEEYICTCPFGSCNDQNGTKITETTHQCYKCVDCHDVNENQLITCPWYNDACFLKRNIDGTYQRGCDRLNHDDIIQKNCHSTSSYQTCKCTQDGCNSDITAQISAFTLLFAIVIAVVGRCDHE